MLRRAMMASGGSVPPGSDPYWANVVSLLHFDGADGSTTFTDEKGKVWTPHGTAKISTAEMLFGGPMGYFDGTGSWIDTPDSTDFTIGSGDFTQEFFMKSPGNTTAYDQACGQRNVSGDNKAAWPATRNNLANTMLLSYTAGAGFVTTAGTAAVYNDSLHHIAVVRNGTSLRQYVDGTLDASLVLPSGKVFDDLATPFSIGRAGAYDGQYFKGYIGQFRLTKGVARYTADFTPPTAAFPNS